MEEVFKDLLVLEGLGKGSSFTLFSGPLGDVESSQGSFDLVVSSSSSLEEDPLVWMEALSHNRFEEETSSELSILEQEEILQGKTSLEGNISVPSISEFSKNWLNSSQDNSSQSLVK